MPKIIKDKPNGTTESLATRVKSLQNAQQEQSTERRVKVLYRSECGLYAILRIKEGSVAEDYLLQWVASPAVFTLECLQPGKRTAYTVILNSANHTYCGCDQYNAGTGSECIHIECIRKLHESGKLK